MSLTFNGFNAPTHTQQLHVEHVEHSTNRNKIEKIHFVLTTSIRLLYSIITYIHGVKECVVSFFRQLGSCSVCLRQWPHCSSLIFCHSFRERASAACLLCSARCSWISSGCSWSNIPCPGLVFLEDKYLGKHNTPIKIMDAVNAWTLGLFFPGSLVTSRWDQCLVPPIPQWALFLDDMGTRRWARVLVVMVVLTA